MLILWRYAKDHYIEIFAVSSPRSYWYRRELSRSPREPSVRRRLHSFSSSFGFDGRGCKNLLLYMCYSIFIYSKSICISSWDSLQLLFVLLFYIIIDYSFFCDLISSELLIYFFTLFNGLLFSNYISWIFEPTFTKFWFKFFSFLTPFRISCISTTGSLSL